VLGEFVDVKHATTLSATAIWAD